jgi:3-methyl-2-oxobutanoate hydroxymethyltransferase
MGPTASTARAPSPPSAPADHALPVCGHVGLIPSKRTWTGGYKAVGKTLESAQVVWNQVKALDAAGAFAAEIEVVPHSITKAIAERTDLFLISMGAGSSGHAQYLFSEDVLGQNRGKIPRHCSVPPLVAQARFQPLGKGQSVGFGHLDDAVFDQHPAKFQLPGRPRLDRCKRRLQGGGVKGAGAQGGNQGLELGFGSLAVGAKL